MIKSIFKYSAAALLMSSVTGKITLASSLTGAGVMMAQTTEPSVGHRTETPIVDGDFLYNGETSGIYELKKTPLLGFQIRISGRTRVSDIDNDRYGAGEKIETFRSIYRVDSSGNEIALEKDILIDFNTPSTYNYLITEADIGSKLKLVYVRKSASDTFTPLPKESYSKEYFTEVVSSPLVQVKPILYVNGVERTDYTMYPGEVGYLRYRVVNRDGQPVQNIYIDELLRGPAGVIKVEDSTINMNAEVERKITALSEGYFDLTASYNGYNLWTTDKTTITVQRRPRP
ncbi:hypothetical protein HP819_004404 [Salmonella enterica subsp. enterica serovar Richmond]|nr:hypothetical protein [Salmonella enterica]ECB7316864.1 hypothetical protein [Salmonella enterica subsp. enterica serovar Treforest]ECD2407145.1 hypothetical protein [Salmonella enterica subsp. enterica serovar Richmond]ECW7884997.1 hypothetical protein [Salmonella enterica subsp. enterica serovar Chester]EAX9991568.1 hypothetical protein [Salmonella enterica]